MDFVHFLSFAEAVKDSLIRDVEIDERDLPEDAAGFAKQAIAAWDALVASGRFRRSAKMIVRAGNEDEIDALYAAFADQLKGRSEGVLALHDNFDLDGSPGAQRRPNVPADLRDRRENFLIHQYMLTEGI